MGTSDVGLGLEQPVPPEPPDHVTTHPVLQPVQTAGESEAEDAALEIVGSQAGAFQIPVRWLRLPIALVLAVANVKLLGEGIRLATPAAASTGPDG